MDWYARRVDLNIYMYAERLPWTVRLRLPEM